jgi:GH15 family glucan-1,4-alpha-glucosidase
MMPIAGFIDPRDPRMLATLDAIEANRPTGTVSSIATSHLTVWR